MPRAHYAEKSGDCESYLEEFLKEGRLNAWASMKVRECCNGVESDDEGRESIAQDRHFNYPRKILRALCGYSEHQRRV